MTQLKTFSTCLLALALHSAAWAEIYETTDAQGNPEFTDSPPRPNSEVIDLQQTNIIDAPAPEPQDEFASQSMDGEAMGGEEAPEQDNRTVIINDRNDDQDDVYDAYQKQERAFERRDPATPDEVLNAEAPREVGDDAASQMPDAAQEVPFEGRRIYHHR
jgi:hypothetical protein